MPDDEEFAILKDVKPKNMKSITKEEEYTNMLKEMDTLLKTKNTKGSKAMLKKLEALTSASEEKKKKEEEKENKKLQAKNVVKLRKMLKDKNVMNDFTYFRKMPVEQQKLVLKKLKDVNDYYKVEKPYRILF